MRFFFYFNIRISGIINQLGISGPGKKSTRANPIKNCVFQAFAIEHFILSLKHLFFVLYRCHVLIGSIQINLCVSISFISILGYPSSFLHKVIQSLFLSRFFSMFAIFFVYNFSKLIVVNYRKFQRFPCCFNLELLPQK